MYPIGFIADKFLGSFDSTPTGETPLNKVELVTLLMHVITNLALPRVLHSFYLRQALRSSHYLEYDPLSRTIVLSATHKRLNELLNQIEQYESTLKITDMIRDWLTKDISSLVRSTDRMNVPNFQLAMIKGVASAVKYLITLMENIVKQLIDPVRPWTELEIPLPPMIFSDDSRDRLVTKEDIESFLTKYVQPNA